MNRRAVGGMRRFTDRLGEGRVRMNGLDQFLYGALESKREHSFGHQFG